MRLDYTRIVEPELEPIVLEDAKSHARITHDRSDLDLEAYVRTARDAAEQTLGRGLLTQTWRLDLPEWSSEIWLPMAAPLQDDAVLQDIVGNSIANPTVVTTLRKHGLTAATSITIAGNVTSSPSINGTYTATPISPTTFSVPVNVTIAGTGGTWVRAVLVTTPVIKYYDVNGTLQTLATTFYTVDTMSRPGRIVRAVNQAWPSLQADRLANTIQITYVVGWTTPDDVPERIKQGIRSYVAYMDLDRDGTTNLAREARDAAEACWLDRVYVMPVECSW